MTEHAGAASADRSMAGSSSSSTATGLRQNRDTAIDVLRGVCIVSMTTAHVAAGSLPYNVTHAAVFIDGAVGFVLLSGVTVGRMQRRAGESTSGQAAGARKLLRRAGLIYLVHLLLCVVGMLVVAADPSRSDLYAGVDDLGGPLPAAAATLGLQVNPHYTSILSLYVLLLLLAVPAVAALSRRSPAPVVAGSLALYVAGVLWPEPFTFAERPGALSPVNWASWQLLFVAALLLGWYWRGPAVRRAVAGRGLVRAATVLVMMCAALGWWTTCGRPAGWTAAVTTVFGDGTLGPGRMIMAFAAVLVGYRICRRVLPVAGWALAPLALIGRHALDCYVVLSLTVILLPGAVTYEPSGWLGVAVTVDVLALMLLWSGFRDLRRRRSTAGVPTHARSDTRADTRADTGRDVSDVPPLLRRLEQ